MNFIQEIEAQVATYILDYVEANAAELEKLLQPYVNQGITDVETFANKISPIVGYAVKLAAEYLNKDLPKFEGDAVKWIEATLEAFINKLQQG